MEMSSDNESSMRRGDVVAYKRVLVYFPPCRRKTQQIIGPVWCAVHRRGADRLLSPLYERAAVMKHQTHISRSKVPISLSFHDRAFAGNHLNAQFARQTEII